MVRKIIEVSKLPPRTLMGMGAAVLLVVMAGLAGWAWMASQERSANAAYTQALIQAQAAHGPGASPADVSTAVAELEAVLARYPSATPAAQAAYELGNLHYEARRWDQARRGYELALSRGLGGPLRPIARLAIGHTWESEKNWGKAVEVYRAVVEGLQPRDFVYELAQLDLARALELAGQKQAAIEAYQAALKAAPAGPMADETRSRLASLGVSVP